MMRELERVSSSTDRSVDADDPEVLEEAGTNSIARSILRLVRGR